MSISEIVLKGLFDLSRYQKQGLLLPDDDKDPIIDFFVYNKLLESVPDPDHPDLNLKYYRITSEGLKELRKLHRHDFFYVIIIALSCVFGSIALEVIHHVLSLPLDYVRVCYVFLMCACFWYRLAYLFSYSRLHAFISDNAFVTISILLTIALLIVSIFAAAALTA